MLSIPAQELEQHGVVSHFTAQAMASQARKLTGSDYGVSLTGVAGPDSLEGHPAGTVFIGLATPNGVDSVQAVSYTHLDVYKRQRVRWSWVMSCQNRKSVCLLAR